MNSGIGSPPGSVEVAIGVAFTALLAMVCYFDYRERRIPNGLLVGMLALATVQILWGRRPTLAAAGWGLVVGGGLFLVAALLARGGMGAGDVKLVAALGAFLGFPLILHAVLFGAVIGALVALALLALRRARKKDTMAYGPYLALGAWIVWLQSLALWPAT